MKSGYVIEYCSSSVAYTHSPTTMEEFIKQRLRWIASTMINNLHLILISTKVTKYSKSVSWFFIIYHILGFTISILTPGNVVLMLAGVYNSAFPIHKLVLIAVNLTIILIFCLICFLAPNRIQMLSMKILGAIFALTMIAVLVSTIIQIRTDSFHSPTFIIFMSVCIIFTIAALLHPGDFKTSVSFAPAMIYYMCSPMMQMLLPLYSLINMNVVSWGTREKTKSDEDISTANQLDVNHNICNGFHFEELHLNNCESNLWTELVTSENGVLNPNQDNKQSEDMKQLRIQLMNRQRNKYATVSLLINILFIATLVLIEVYLNAEMVAITIPIVDYSFELELIGLVVLSMLAVYFVFQFLSLIIHRYIIMWRYISDDKLNLDNFELNCDEEICLRKISTISDDKYEVITRF